MSMQLQPVVRFRGVRPSAGLEDEIRRRMARLTTYYPSIIGCEVLVEFSDRHHQAGRRFDVRIDLTVPHGHLSVSHAASARATARELEKEKVSKRDELDRGHRYALVAVREAFETVRRRLQDFARRQRGTVKLHTHAPRGRVVRLTDGYGFIEAPDGHEVYFQESSVLEDGFKRLKVGSSVSFAEERGDKGPQASSVRAVR